MKVKTSTIELEIQKRIQKNLPILNDKVRIYREYQNWSIGNCVVIVIKCSRKDTSIILWKQKRLLLRILLRFFQDPLLVIEYKNTRYPLLRKTVLQNWIAPKNINGYGKEFN